MTEIYNSPKLYITGGKLDTYQTCPKKYYYANIRKLQKPFEKPSPLLVFDQSIHKALKSFYQFHNNKEPFDFAKLRKCLDYSWHNSDFEKPEISSEYKDLAINILKNYFEKINESEDKHIDTDYFFKANLAGIEYGGKIDRIDKNPDGSLEIIDYKTGKMPANGVSELEESLTVQMLFLACNVIFPSPVKRLTFVYLKENQILFVERNEKKLELAIEKLKKITESIIKGDFSPTPSNACSWCDFKDQCPEGQINILSVSKLKYFLDCPQKYSFKYIKKQPLTDNSPKAPLLFYSYISSMLFNLYKGKKLYSVAKLIEHSKKALSAHKELDQETSEKLLKDCQITFEYIHKQITQNGFPESQSLKTELKTDYNSIILSVNIDRLDILSNGKLQPVVYKTGRQIPNIKSIQNDVTSAMYWFVTNQLYPDQIESISFVYLLSEQVIDFIPSETAINRLKDSISYFITEKDFRGEQGSLCAWCDYYGPCPEWKIKPYEIAKETPEVFKQRIRLSYSKMDQYIRCPYVYKKVYIDKIAPKPKPFFEFGTTIHETFEQFYDSSKFITDKPTLDELITIFEKTRLCHRDSFINEEQEKEFYQKGIRQLTLYYNHYIKNKIFKPADKVEQYFEIPCGKYSVMTGSIDRIDALEDGTYEILDYKTEKYPRPQADVDKDKQLSIYYWAAQTILGYKISRLSLLMLESDTKMKTTRTDKEIEKVLDFIDKTAYEMINATEFPRKKNKYCSGCDYLDDCPYKEEIEADQTIKSMQDFSEEIVDIDV